MVSDTVVRACDNNLHNGKVIPGTLALPNRVLRSFKTHRGVVYKGAMTFTMWLLAAQDKSV